MQRTTYSAYRTYTPQRRYSSHPPKPSSKRSRMLWGIGMVVFLLTAGFVAYKLLAPKTIATVTRHELKFDSSVTSAERQAIDQAIKSQSKTYKGTVNVHVGTSLTAGNVSSVLSVYVPVTNAYAPRQQVSAAELAGLSVYVPSDVDNTTRAAIAKALGLAPTKLSQLSASSIEQVDVDAVAFVPLSELSPKLKLLNFEGSYYLDSIQKGAVFREAEFSGGSVTGLTGLSLNSYATKDGTMKVNQTGVTALTRQMMKKLDAVKDAKYFSKLIGPFLRDADVIHVSNEVSFNPNCQYSTASFCAPPAMIDTLKDSGVNLVELTGNHNNDNGNLNNRDTINLYHSLGWATFGGGLNTTEAAKPYIADKKGSKVAFVGYNAADGINSGVIATSSTAGGNFFSLDTAKADIAAAKRSAQFVIVDMQYWECYAYPDGFVEYPICDLPIGDQESIFRQLIDDGADMVVGTQAHQPQTFELYHGKPIYYGLGNLYFEQTRWPGTERGIILTHYFQGGKLVQTKVSPTIYDDALQTHLMVDSDAVSFLQRLATARASL